VWTPKAAAVKLASSDLPGLGQGKDMAKGTNEV
jgi:hypothetical protein